jgi:hypothetical protein
MCRLHWTKLPFCWICPLLKGLGMSLLSGFLNVTEKLDSLMLLDSYYTEIEYEHGGTLCPSVSFYIF